MHKYIRGVVRFKNEIIGFVFWGQFQLKQKCSLI